MKHALYFLPILLLTMHARVALNDHTVSAVIVGALLGFMMAAIFTSGRTDSPSRFGSRIALARLQQWLMPKSYAKKRVTRLIDARASENRVSGPGQ